MKMSIFKPLMSVLVIVLMTGVVSCEKMEEEQLPSLATDGKALSHGDLAKVQAGWVLVYVPDEPYLFCSFAGKNCWWPPIDIVGHHLTELDSYMSNGNVGVQLFFSDKSKWKPVFPGLATIESKPFLNKLQSGNYTMEKITGQGDLILYVAKGGNPHEEFAFQVLPR